MPATAAVSARTSIRTTCSCCKCRDSGAGAFILTGSQQLGLLEAVSQTPAGRTALLQLLPLDLTEIQRFPKSAADLWTIVWTGGYPRIYDRRLPAAEWLSSYMATYVERDVRQLVNVTDLVAFQTFVRLCAGRVGQLVNASALGGSLGGVTLWMTPGPLDQTHVARGSTA